MERKRIVIILFLLVLLGAVGVFIYKKNQFGINNVTDPQSGDINSQVSSTVDKAKQAEFEDAIKKTVSTDQDMDGIPDNEEAKYKTDPNSADTDSDGLTDWQEVSIFLTDPLKSDTDGDAFIDGYEVRYGFSPKGPGKL